MARFSIEFPPERLRSAITAPLDVGVLCGRVTDTVSVLFIEAFKAQVELAVNICINHEGQYLLRGDTPSSSPWVCP